MHTSPPVQGSEVVYDVEFHLPLLQCLRAVTVPGSTVYMSHKDRALGTATVDSTVLDSLSRLLLCQPFTTPHAPYDVPVLRARAS